MGHSWMYVFSLSSENKILKYMCLYVHHMPLADVIETDLQPFRLLCVVGTRLLCASKFLWRSVKVGRDFRSIAILQRRCNGGLNRWDG
jgi:hypothetical protein